MVTLYVVNSYIRDVDKREVSLSIEFCAARLWEEKHTLTKLKEMVSMKMAVESSKKCNTDEVRETKESQSVWNIDEAYSFQLYLGELCGTSPHVEGIHHVEASKASVIS